MDSTDQPLAGREPFESKPRCNDQLVTFYCTAPFAPEDNVCSQPDILYDHSRALFAWRIAMKAFMLACVATIAIAAVAVPVLNSVQQPVAQAFATTGVRL